MDVRIHELRGFVAVAEEGSFTRAAARLFLSQPALSKQIQVLEAAVRAPLVLRTPAGVVLTAAGSALLPRARAAVEAWDSGRKEIERLLEEQSHRLVVGMSIATLLERFSHGVRLFSLAQPLYELEVRQVTFDDSSIGLADEVVDVALGWLPLADEDRFRWEVLYEDERWLAVPADHRLAGRSSVRFEELRDEPFLALPESAGPKRRFWLAEDERTQPARIGAVVHGPEEALTALASGRGVSLIAATDAAVYSRASYVAVPLTGIAPCRFAVIWRAGDTRPAVADFVTAMREAGPAAAA